MHEIGLNRCREAHGKTVQVHLIDVQTLRFEIEVMPLPIRETHHLVFQGWTVSWSNALNLAVVERRLADVSPDKLVHPWGGVERVTIDLRTVDPVGHERERNRWIVASLTLEAGEI